MRGPCCYGRTGGPMLGDPRLDHQEEEEEEEEAAYHPDPRIQHFLFLCKNGCVIYAYASLLCLVLFPQKQMLI